MKILRYITGTLALSIGIYYLIGTHKILSIWWFVISISLFFEMGKTRRVVGILFSLFVFMFINVGVNYTDSRNIIKQDIRNKISSCGKGIADDCMILGDMYYDGGVVKRDYNKSIIFYMKAVDNNIPLAKYKVGKMMLEGKGVNPDNKLAYLYLNSVCLDKTVPEHTRACKLLKTIR